MTTTLRPNTVDRADRLLVFFDYLAAHHPEVRRLDADRTDPPHRALPGLGHGTAVARPNRERRPVGLAVVPPRRRRPALLLRRHRRLGLGRSAAAAAAVRRRHPAPARRAAPGTDPRRRPGADGRRRRPRRPVRPHRAAAAARDRHAPRRTARPRAGLPAGLRQPRHLAEGPARQARHRTHRPARRRTPSRVLDDWIAQRGPQRALPHPRDGRPTDFLFVERGRRLTAFRLRHGLDRRRRRAPGLRGRDGQLCTSPPTSCGTPSAPAWSTAAWRCRR